MLPMESPRAGLLRNQTPPVSIKQISKRLGIAYATAWKYVKALEEE